jgi:hypothetical protein
MPSPYIATRLHNALEVDPDEPTLQRMSELPHYVIDQRLIDILGRADVAECFKSLRQAEMAQLPFPEITVEFEARQARWFALVREESQGFRVRMAWLTAEAMDVNTLPLEVTWRDKNLHVSHQSSEVEGMAAGFAVAVSLLMLVTRGLEKETIEPQALNKKRQAKGAPRIPNHTVVHIASVYDREGNSVRAAGLRSLAIHLRAGHARWQAHGEQWSLRKLIFLPPTLVGYSPGDDISPAPAGETVWFTEESIAAWRAEPRTTRGGQPHYSALKIKTALML